MIATVAGMNSARLTSALPPLMNVLPLYLPLSLVNGASPAMAADLRRPTPGRTGGSCWGSAA